MEEILSKTIRWECTNWFFREDGFIQVYTQIGGKVILNEVLTKIWSNIDYETTIGDLWEKVKNSVSEEEFIDSIKEIDLYQLVSVSDKSDEFDSIFN